ncbi:MAG: type IVB secretion system protein IcmH/DotU [Methylovirgula sp.]
MQPSAHDPDEPTVIGHRPSPIGGDAGPTAPVGSGLGSPGFGNSGLGIPGAAGAHPPRDPLLGRPMPPGNAPDAFSRDAGASTPTPAGAGRNLPLDISDMQNMADPQQPEDAIAAAAVPLLMLVAQLRNAVEFADVEALRRETTEQMKKFEERAIKFGARAASVSAARYILCALIDETVMTTPWGSASQWSASSLLNQFHGETWGGEKVFTILDRVKSDVDKYLALLKLIDLVLAFGFEGKYRVIEGGRYQLDELRNEVSGLWHSHARALPRELSPQWRGVSARRDLRSYVPLWVGFACTGALLLAIYGFLAFRLNSALAPVTAILQQLAHGG